MQACSGTGHARDHAPVVTHYDISGCACCILYTFLSLFVWVCVQPGTERSSKMSTRYKYCDVCRGDDGPFATCLVCKRKFHADCANIVGPLQDFTCSICKAEEGDETEDEIDKAWVDRAKHNLMRFGLVKELVKYHASTKAAFLDENAESLSIWCGKEELRAIVKKGRQQTFSKKFASTVIAKMNGPFLATPSNPPYLANATLRDYQCDGVATLCSWFQRGIGGILADEMGLGKTIQTIAFIGACKHHLGIAGPHLIVTPLAVVQNW